MKTLSSLLGAVALSCFLGASATSAQTYTLEKIWEKHPGDYTQFLVTSHLERGIAHNPTTGHLLIPSRNNNSVHIIKAENGEYVTQLNMAGVDGGTFKINKIEITADGAIYVGNLTTDTSSGNNFKLYRWENESAEAVLLFDGDPSGGSSDNKRWGDSLAVRGTGADTEVLLGDYVGSILAILRPDPDNLMAPNSFTAHQIYTDLPANSARNVAFGQGSIIYVTTTSTSPDAGFLYELELDLESYFQISRREFNGAILPRELGPLAYDAGHDILVGLLPLSHGVHVYKRTHLTNQWTVLPIATYKFTPSQPGDTYVGNQNATGEVVIAGDIIYALDTNNSLAALRFVTDEPAGGFADWIASFDLPEDQRGTEDDPDGDGLNNLLEYALGGNPAIANRDIAPAIGIETSGDEQYLSIAFIINEEAAVSYTVEVSGDLLTWESGESATTVVTDSAEGTIVRDNTPMSSSSRRFIRLRVEE